MYAAILLMIAASQEPQLKQPDAANFANWKYFENAKLRQVAPTIMELSQATPAGCAIPLLHAQRDETTTKSNMPLIQPNSQHTMPIVAPVPVCQGFGK